MRIGHGYDAHRFSQDGLLIIGGVHIPFDKGLLAHSDGDVLIHALCDALLGAAGCGDIGKHFPDSEKKFKGINSRLLLQQVLLTISEKKLSISNIDITVVAQEPKLAPYLDEMKKNLAQDLAIHPNQINIKATTTEGMGFTGRMEGIATHAVVLLESFD